METQGAHQIGYYCSAKNSFDYIFHQPAPPKLAYSYYIYDIEAIPNSPPNSTTAPSPTAPSITNEAQRNHGPFSPSPPIICRPCLVPLNIPPAPQAYLHRQMHIQSPLHAHEPPTHRLTNSHQSTSSIVSPNPPTT